MHTAAERNISLWSATATTPGCEPLREDLDTDVCVVGAGIAGLTTAYLLAREGRSVVVLDDGPIGGGQTRRTSAHLTCVLDRRYADIEHIHGSEGARVAAESHTAAIDCIERIVAECGIDCEFERVDGFLFPGTAGDTKHLEEERAAAQRAGLGGVQLRRSVVGDALCYPRQAQFHPLRYLAGLATALRQRSARIHTGTHVTRVSGGAVTTVKAADARVHADAAVVATNVPINNLLIPHLKQAPYLTYVIGAPISPGSVPRALYWDTADPYHYVRVQSVPVPGSNEKRELLIVGGEDHKTGQANDSEARFQRLASWARARFPSVQEVEFHWSGQVMETLDGLGFIGRNPHDADNVYIATGDSGVGLTHGTIAGLILTDLIQGRANPWARYYDPSRKPVRAFGASLREDINMAAQFGDWISGGEIASCDELAHDSGAVVREGLHKVAAYRDETGTLHRYSAACPHLGCQVHWNVSEKTWDCPCHGSRFDRFGRVINGPANRNLADAQAHKRRA